MIDPVSMYLLNGSRPANGGLESAYVAPVDAERRRQQAAQQQPQDQSNQGQDTGVVVSISEEARSQARMGSMLASDASEMPAEGAEVTSFTENNVKETPLFNGEDSSQISKDENLLRAEAQYQAAGTMAMAGRSMLGETTGTGREESTEPQNMVEEVGSSSNQNDMLNANRPMEVAANEETQGMSGAAQAGEAAENETSVEQAAERTENTNQGNQAMEYISRTPFNYVSQTYQGMTSRMEPLMSSFMLGV